MDEESFNRGFAIKLSRWLYAVLIFLFVSGIISFEGRELNQAAKNKTLIFESDQSEFQKRNIVKFNSRKKAEQFFAPIIIQVANKHDIDPDLIKAIIMAESGYNPQAISKKGAKGLMQLMPKTAEALGVEDIFNPAHNINGGVKYFKQLLKKFKGDIKMALAAYNAGIRRVKEYQGIPPIGATRYYIEKVFEYYQYYKDEKPIKTEKA
ncbi:MAG TPA: lytic transglycosylase domain-containing protein [Desulfobacteraceae bacterium]|nr:lytic transglycosylase domain-containing protein [Desulfobacteraceae bacterium]HPJ66186.1 lytic transglycosylase domain-containing protein [Desulfobacteraceae bacterium]HPQ27082.1 lytic transglycosylase domain-containing protein [Desulfobacteraceae bacterium]